MSHRQENTPQEQQRNGAGSFTAWYGAFGDHRCRGGGHRCRLRPFNSALLLFYQRQRLAAVLPAGGARSTESQLKALTIVPVAPRAFHGEEIGDGSISIDEDFDAGVLPSAGRVTRVIAKLGDVVEKLARR